MYATFVLALVLLVQQSPPIQSPKTTQKNASQPRTDTQNKITTPGQDRVGTAKPESKDSSADKKQESDSEYDRWLNHMYEWATIVGVIGGWVVLAIVWRQSQAVINAERAWIMVEVRTPASANDGTLFVQELSSREADGPQIDSTVVMPLLVCKNQGKTPGWIFYRSLRCQVWNGNMERPQIPDFSSDLHFEVDKDIKPVAVGSESFRFFPYKISGGKRTKPNDYILVYGVVRYRDIFGKKRQTVFGWQIHGNWDLLPVQAAAFHQMD